MIYGNIKKIEGLICKVAKTVNNDVSCLTFLSWRALARRSQSCTTISDMMLHSLELAHLLNANLQFRPFQTQLIFRIYTILLPLRIFPKKPPKEKKLFLAKPVLAACSCATLLGVAVLDDIFFTLSMLV